jgi:hypothetical protein
VLGTDLDEARGLLEAQWLAVREQLALDRREQRGHVVWD